MPHIVARAEPCESTEMIGIDFAGVPCHRLRHSKGLCAPGSQEVIPEPDIGPQFGVVPREAADIVSPRVPGTIVGMHHVAVIPEAIPVPLFNFLVIEGKGRVKMIFDRGARTSRTVGKTPYAEHF